MTPFLIYFAIIALGVGLWLSRIDWAKMLALVPVGALVPAFYGAAVNCGAGFALDFFGPGSCTGDATPRAVFAAMFVVTE